MLDLAARGRLVTNAHWQDTNAAPAGRVTEPASNAIPVAAPTSAPHLVGNKEAFISLSSLPSYQTYVSAAIYRNSNSKIVYYGVRQRSFTARQQGVAVTGRVWTRHFAIVRSTNDVVLAATLRALSNSKAEPTTSFALLPLFRIAPAFQQDLGRIVGMCN